MKLLVITGASKGIGRACAERFRSADYDVINISRSPCPVEGVTNHAVDLTSSGYAELIERPLIDAAKKADVVVVIHNAAVMDKDTAATIDPELFRRALELQLVAPAVLNSWLMPHMKPGSSILYVGSTLSEKAVAGVASYVTTKHAVVGLMRATCQDLVDTGVHTACVCPGFTDTEMLRVHIKGDEAVLEALAGMVTLKRLIEPAEIADTLMFVAQNPVMNGAVLHANLGQIEH
jgi:3-oxoacyl-[acyl-carrier protein] reductase